MEEEILKAETIVWTEWEICLRSKKEAHARDFQGNY